MACILEGIIRWGKEGRVFEPVERRDELGPLKKTDKGREVGIGREDVDDRRREGRELRGTWVDIGLGSLERHLLASAGQSLAGE